MLDSLATSETDMSLAICALLVNKIKIYALTIIRLIVRIIIRERNLSVDDVFAITYYCNESTVGGVD